MSSIDGIAPSEIIIASIVDSPHACRCCCCRWRLTRRCLPLCDNSIALPPSNVDDIQRDGGNHLPYCAVMRRHAPFQLFHHHTTVEMDFSYCTDCSHSLCICLSPCLSMTNIDWTEEYTKQWIHCTNKQRDARAWFSIGHSQRITIIIINQKLITQQSVCEWVLLIFYSMEDRMENINRNWNVWQFYLPAITLWFCWMSWPSGRTAVC